MVFGGPPLVHPVIVPKVRSSRRGIFFVFQANLSFLSFCLFFLLLTYQSYYFFCFLLYEMSLIFELFRYIRGENYYLACDTVERFIFPVYLVFPRNTSFFYIKKDVLSFFFCRPHEGGNRNTRILNTLCDSGDEPRCRATPHQTWPRMCAFHHHLPHRFFFIRVMNV